MRFMRLLVVGSVIIFMIGACVDSLDQTLGQHINLIVVDGLVTNLAEPQIVALNHAQSDPLTGRFGNLPITGATVQIIVDSTQAISYRETTAGRYQAPDGFKGQIGHAYQLRFRLKEGTQYQSTMQVMPSVPPIQRVYERFNTTSLAPGLLNSEQYRGASDFYVDWQDPATEHNYYRWDWLLWEQQDWCRSCAKGFYYIWWPADEAVLWEDCEEIDPYQTAQLGVPYFVNDYQCRTPCWEIIHNYDANLFDDALSNGGHLTGRRVAQIPNYQAKGCLVEVRQSSLTANAYTYFHSFQQQTQNTGSLADTPPTALVGNIRNQTNSQEAVVGYFTASSVSAVRYWLDRTDVSGLAPGLFQAQHGGLLPSPEGGPDPNTGAYKFSIGVSPDSKNKQRPPTAVCQESETRTPTKPDGWRD